MLNKLKLFIQYILVYNIVIHISLIIILCTVVYIMAVIQH